MQQSVKLIFKKAVLPLSTMLCSFAGIGQTNSTNLNPGAILKHGIEQYQNGHYSLATFTLNEFLDYNKSINHKDFDKIPYLDKAQALYYKTLAGVKLRDQALVAEAVEYVNNEVNPNYKQRVAYELAKYYLEDNRNLLAAIDYYEIAGVENLSNEEIVDSKFELGYAYFITQQFDKARNLFVGIKDIESNKYYKPANYYYGLLSYKDGKLDEALKSFKKIKDVEEYKDIIPYYETEIYYFKGDYNKVLENSNKYLSKKGTLYYDKEMRLLTGQTLFELKRYSEALPYFEEYYENTDRIRKEELYELGYTYYQLGRYEDAIDKFQPLSNSNDTIAQTSMYLLGDCYLKSNDKKGARNAFGLCSEMNFNQQQKEDATFLYNKLSYELGFDQIATSGFNQFINNYPENEAVPEAKSLLSSLLIKSNNYSEAYALLKDVPNKDGMAWATYQKAAVGRGLQLLQDKKYDQAEEYLSASLENPVNPSLEAVAYFWKGEIAYQNDRYADAVSYNKAFLSKSKGYEEAIKKASAKATVQNANVNLGYASLKAGSYSEAGNAFANVQKGNDAKNDNVSKDAIIRQADAAFMQKDFDAAAKLYDKAIASNVGDIEYARYQKALILGLQNKNSEKIELLKVVVQNGNAKIKEEANLELATEYIAIDKFTEAITILKKLDNNQTQIGNRTKAAYLEAYAYQESNQKEAAIVAYKKYITQYPTGTDRTTALKALSSLYSNNPDAYVSFLEKENIADVSTSDVEEVFYDAADDEFSKGNYALAVESFKKYLTKYPNGNFKIQAQYFLGESYYQLKQYNNAVEQFDNVLSNNWNDYSADATARKAQIKFDKKEYTAAKQDYETLLQNNASESRTDIAENMMKIAFEEKDYSSTISWSDKITNDIAITETSKANALLYKAKAIQAQNNLNEAKTIYQQIDKLNIGDASAEARFEIANILFIQKNNVEAEKAASYASRASNNNAYWTVKNYILLADILADNKDYFNAKATLQSVIKNSKDADLVAIANQKLTEVKAKESGKSKLGE